MKVLALDQGTTSTKAFTYDSDGQFQKIFTSDVTQFYPHANWVEHDPQELLGHIQKAIKAAGKIDCIGIANQGETLLAWHAKTKIPLGKAIVWQDARSQSFCDILKAQGAESLTKQKAGLALDAYFSASKFRWILDNIPEAKTLAAEGLLCLGTSDAFFMHHLGGEFVTDVSTASRTSLMSLDTLQWDQELCELFGVPMACLPEIRSSTGPFSGKVSASLVDQQAALFGHGCEHIADSKITFGTGAFALALSGNMRPIDEGAGLSPTVAWKQNNKPAQFAWEGGIFNAASAVNWAKTIGLFQDYSEINQFSSPTALARGVVFVPALSGLAAPHWDRNAAGLWIGLGLGTSKQDMMQALLEGIALRAAEVLRAMGLGSSVSIDGGLSHNPYFCQFLANCLGREIRVAATADLTALGIARMAMIGAGRETLPALPPPARLYQPKDIVSSEHLSRFSEAVKRAKNWKTF